MASPPPLPPAPRAQPNRTYRALERIGRWPVGTVFAGRAQPSGEPCTILFPDVIGADVGPFVAAMADEVARNRLLADLPLIGLTHIGLDLQHHPFLVLPLEQGPDLETWVHTHGPLRPLTAIQVGVELADVLVRLHYRTRALGELRPWTIRLPQRAGDSLSILDLGLCRGLFDRAIRPPRPSPVFASPNVRAGGLPRPPDDVYAVGAALYFALTGEPTPPTPTRPSSKRPLGAFGPFIDAVVLQALGHLGGPQPITGMVQLARALRGLRDLHRLSPAARQVALRARGEGPTLPPPAPGAAPTSLGPLGYVETDGPVFDTQVGVEMQSEAPETLSVGSELEILDDDALERLRTGELPTLVIPAKG